MWLELNQKLLLREKQKGDATTSDDEKEIIFDPQFKLPPKQEFASRLKTFSNEEKTDDLIDRAIEMCSEV